MDKTTVLVREIGERLLELAVVMEQMGHSEVPQPVRIVPEDERVVSAATAAKYLGVGHRTVTRWLADGRIPGAWREEAAGGFRWMIPASALDKMEKKEPEQVVARRSRTNPKPSAATARLRRRWTEDEDRHLMELVEEGLPYAAIGTMLRRSESAVTCRIAALRNGVAGPSSVIGAPVDEGVTDEWTGEQHAKQELSFDPVSEERPPPIPNYGPPTSSSRLTRWFRGGDA